MGIVLMFYIRALLAIIGFLLSGYSVYLVFDNKIHVGTILPLLIGIGFIGYAFCYSKLQSVLIPHPILQKSITLFIAIFWLWVVSVFLFFGFIHHHNKKQSTIDTDFKAIIILGSKSTNGVPSPSLKNRLDTAIKVANKNPNAYLITTGGIGFGETISEAGSAKNYLITQHINSDKILIENQSTSTELNLINSLPILNTHHIHHDDKIAIVTSDFHTLRALKIANKQGYTNIIMIPAPTPLQTRYHSWLREYFAFISGFLLKEY